MIDEEGGVSEVIQTDVTDEASCKAAVARTVELFGAVHVLVNIGACFTWKGLRGSLMLARLDLSLLLGFP